MLTDIGQMGPEEYAKVTAHTVHACQHFAERTVYAAVNTYKAHLDPPPTTVSLDFLSSEAVDEIAEIVERYLPDDFESDPFWIASIPGDLGSDHAEVDKAYAEMDDEDRHGDVEEREAELEDLVESKEPTKGSKARKVGFLLQNFRRSFLLIFSF